MMRDYRSRGLITILPRRLDFSTGRFVLEIQDHEHNYGRGREIIHWWAIFAGLM